MKTALITGGTRGIGKAIALDLASRGYRLMLIYNSNESEANKTLDQLKGQNHIIYKCDVTNKDELHRMIDYVKDNNVQIHVLINNAGIGFHHPLDQISFDDWANAWDAILNVNLVAMANVCFLVANRMIEKNIKGYIINITSRGGRRGEPLMPAYGASKAGANSLTQSLAYHLAPHHIFVGAVAPGFVETEMSRPRLQGEVGEAIKSQSPLGRVAQPNEIAQAVHAMLESPLWMSGNIFDANGASYFR